MERIAIFSYFKYLCKIQTGSQDTQDAVDEGHYPFYVRSPIVERIDKYVFDGEAVLMAGDGVGAGRIFHYVNDKFGCHQRVYIINSFKHVIGKFLYYYMQSFFSLEVEKGSAKSTVDSIRLPMLQNFLVCYPTIAEQNNIAFHYEIFPTALAFTEVNILLKHFCKFKFKNICNRPERILYTHKRRICNTGFKCTDRDIIFFCELLFCFGCRNCGLSDLL